MDKSEIPHLAEVMRSPTAADRWRNRFRCKPYPEVPSVRKDSEKKSVSEKHRMKHRRRSYQKIEEERSTDCTKIIYLRAFRRARLESEKVDSILRPARKSIPHGRDCRLPPSAAPGTTSLPASLQAQPLRDAHASVPLRAICHTHTDAPMVDRTNIDSDAGFI